jgi:phosphoribosyl 1,2-cyclic phosphodiesterase
MFQTSVLVSGSKGNAVLVRTGEVAVLLDAGVAAKGIFAALEDLRVDRREIKAILVSHEHSDHTMGVGAVARMLKIPLYINLDTHARCEHRLGRLPEGVMYFETGRSFSIRDMLVHPFQSSHDAADSCNFTFMRVGDKERKLGVATDLGFPTTMSVTHLKHCTTLVLESNHDMQMLMNGPYDWSLKQRIKSNAGHLSNLQAVGVVSQIMHHGLENIILAHLSEINNDPALARKTMEDYLQAIRSDINLLVAEQRHHTPLLNI